MSDSTRRTIRTVVQTLLALCTVAPVVLGILLSVLPEGDFKINAAAVFASILVGVGVITKAWNALEDGGFLPGWLKGDVIVAVPDATGAHEITTLPPAHPGDETDPADGIPLEEYLGDQGGTQ